MQTSVIVLYSLCLCLYLLQNYIISMDIEKHDKRQILKSNLVNKMKKAESISKNLTKIVKIAQKISPSRTPIDQSFHSSIQAYEKCGILTTRNHNTSVVKSGDVSLIGQKCRKCEKIVSMLVMAKQEKERIQQKYNQLVSKYSQLQKQKKSMQSKLLQLQKTLEQTNTSIQPYKNNVVLMQRHLESIKQSLSHPSALTTQYGILPSHSLVSGYGYVDGDGYGSRLAKEHKDINEQLKQKKKAMDCELNYLMKTYQRQQQSTQSKLTRLTLIIHTLSTRNNEKQQKISELEHQISILTSIIKQSTYTIQQRELFHMSSQQLYQTKLELSTMKQNNKKLNNYIDKLCNKISMLTSLIGYGVISNIQNNDLHQIYALKANMGELSRLQEKICGEGLTGGVSGRSMKICGVKEFVTKQTQCNMLHQPNILIYFQDQQIKTGLQQNVSTIIKPQFFILIRAILDAKYCQFLTEGTKASRFQQFTYAFIQFFKVSTNYRRVQVCFKRSSDQKELMKNNFLLRVFDKKVAYLPEIATFREFLMKNATQDEIFYYLMCRNLLYNGPELNTYLGSSDPYNFTPYQRIIQRIQPLLHQLDKSSKTMIFKHINQKKILKNNKLLLKTNYILRIILETYRKIRRQRVHKLRVIFEQTLRLTKCQIIKYIHFKQILSRNFCYLTHLDIANFYRRTLAVVQAVGEGKNGGFFQIFVAVCMEDIMVKDIIVMDQKIKGHYFSSKSIQRCNYLMQLIPDSVSQLAQQTIYTQYTTIIKQKSLDTNNRIQTSKLLLKMISLLNNSYDSSNNGNGNNNGNNNGKQEQKINGILDELNNNLIDVINNNFRRRQKYQLSLEKASSIIGGCFKKKIYQFYQEFVKDIKVSVLVGK